MLESDMVSNNEDLTDNSKIPLRTSLPVKNPSTRKSLSQFSKVLDVKQKTFVLILGSDEPKPKATSTGNMSRSII